MTAIDKLTDEQAAFEAWADSREKATLRSSTSGDFDYPLGHLLWEAWSARAALAGAAAAIPEGFVLVPVEPTREMMDAGAAHAIREDEDEDKYRARGQAFAIYSDMLAAAPGAATPLAATPAQAVEEAGIAQEPQWIVNDLGELGVKVGGRFFFLYKGDNIEYGTAKESARDGIALHDDGAPMKYRMVGKREFGETCHPLKFTLQNRRAPYPYTDELIYTPGLSYGKPEDGAWRELPAALRAATKEQQP